MKNYVVIDMRNESFGLGARSEKPGVDFALHLGGMTFDQARKTADKLNEQGHQPEPEQGLKRRHD